MRISFSTILSIFLLPFLFASCHLSSPNADIEGISLTLDVKRTDSLLFAAAKAFRNQAHPDTFAIYQQFLQQDRDFWIELSPFYEKMQKDSVSTAVKDSILSLYYGRFLADSNGYKLLDSVKKKIPYNFPFEERLTPLFKRVKKHLPEAKIPKIRTYISGYTPPGIMPQVDQTLPTISGEYFGIGLHYWMGAKFFYYSPDIPVFIKKRFDLRFLEVVIATQIGDDVVPEVDLRNNPSFLDKVIRLGIRQNLIDALLPNEPDSMKLYYSDKQMYWADLYEKNIYKEIVQSLYSKDFTVHQKYISEKPFTSDLAQESAPRLAQYFGWKVVQSYLKNHPEVRITQLIERTDYETIWKESKYKP